ncbi:CDP-alcohol phosphatidyltransferase family protein [Phragmitibacter flavus]|uniref:CDP-alcohol phosphatidyltransferase family protein n=1 Tax=Phragmitibacter flavus TaxID=2576071 RepID=A0A5R8KGG5_9BACT|nr:CDP-alcohol phosphatidyltransferase family protein [Phragmitibacter flavus]TLD71392.1 CDP-alcohol phosphatidyltransferase family protein [Phragmitibacter flavus]
MASDPVEGARRELKTRQAGWAKKLAAFLVKTPITPNIISVISILFAVLGAICFIMIPTAPCQWGGTLLWFGAATCIQLRLLCNLLDGMVAIEGGKKSPTGGLYNEVPDRIADILFLAAAGYTASNHLLHFDIAKPIAEGGCCNFALIGTLSQHVLYGIPLGWLVVALAVTAPYIRVLGGTLTGTQSFIGPMAKQHRMFLLTVACFLSIAELWLWNPGNHGHSVMWFTLLFMAIGTLWTCIRRLNLIARQLNQNPSA